MKKKGRRVDLYDTSCKNIIENIKQLGNSYQSTACVRYKGASSFITPGKGVNDE